MLSKMSTLKKKKKLHLENKVKISASSLLYFLCLLAVLAYIECIFTA